MKFQNHPGVFALLGLILILSACESKEVKNARNYMDLGMHSEAIAYMDDLLKKDPTNSDILLVKGELFLRSNSYDKAKQVFKSAISIKSSLKADVGELYIIDLEDHLSNRAVDPTDIQRSTRDGISLNPDQKEEVVKILMNHVNESKAEHYAFNDLFDIIIELDASKKSEIAAILMNKSEEQFQTDKEKLNWSVLDAIVRLDTTHVNRVSSMYFELGLSALESKIDRLLFMERFDKSLSYTPEVKDSVAEIYFNHATNLFHENNTVFPLSFYQRIVELDTIQKDSTAALAMKIARKFDSKEVKERTLEFAYFSKQTDKKFEREYNRLHSKYYVTKIGSTYWSTENLNTTTFRNGDEIPQVKNYREYELALKRKAPAWCYYEFDPDNESIYGKLYNRFALEDSRGIAPRGYRLPKKSDVDAIIEELGEEFAGDKLKSKKYWNGTGEGLDSFGFNGVPSGDYSGSFYGMGQRSYYWVVNDDENRFDDAYYDYLTFQLSERSNKISTHYSGNRDGIYMSVRLIKN